MVSYFVFSCEQSDDAEEKVENALSEFISDGISQATLLVSYPQYTLMYFLICQDPDGAWYWLQTESGDWYDITHQPVRDRFTRQATSYTLIGA